MNWLGKKISKHISELDTVLDLGCGIMQSTTGIYDNKESMECRTILGVELVKKYLDKVKYHYPTIRSDVLHSDELFVDDSYDVVLCLDTLEHLDLGGAVYLLKEMKRIARRIVIIYTPLKFDKNGDNVDNAWGIGENELQKHNCLITPDILDKMGYKNEITEIEGNLFGVYEK